MLSGKSHEINPLKAVEIGSKEIQINKLQEKIYKCENDIQRFKQDIDFLENEKKKLFERIDIEKTELKELKEKESIKTALELIREYFSKEFGKEEHVDFNSCFKDLSRIAVAFTTVDDLEENEYELQVYVDLKGYRLVFELNGKVVEETNYEGLDELIENELEWLEFDSLVRVNDEWFKESNQNKSINEKEDTR